jgi:hypothetical protein
MCAKLWRGKAMSSVYLPSPTRNRASSLRLIEAPITPLAIVFASPKSRAGSCSFSARPLAMVARSARPFQTRRCLHRRGRAFVAIYKTAALREHGHQCGGAMNTPRG